MENKKNNSTVGFVLYALSVVFSLVSILVYRFLPESDLANGIEHTGMDAVKALTVSPIAAALALILFGISCFKLFGSFSSGLLKKIVFGASAISFLGLIFNFVSSLRFLLKQNKLGFVAPFNDTVWETLLSVMAVVFAVQCILLIFEILYDKGIIKIKA